MKWLRNLFGSKESRLSENPEAHVSAASVQGILGATERNSENPEAHVSEGLPSNTTLAAWGDNIDGETDAPAGMDFVAIAAGGFHSLALRKDGSLAAWGDNEKGQTNVPAGTNFVAIAAGVFHSLALRKDGALAAWGNNEIGQTKVPAGKDFVAIAAGGFHNLALRGDASVREALSVRLNATPTERNVRDDAEDGSSSEQETSRDHPKESLKKSPAHSRSSL